MVIQRKEMQEIVSDYSSDITIAVVCSHSGLPTAASAKAAGFRTIGITTAGRDRTYAEYNKNLFDDFRYVKEFKRDATKIDERIQEEIIRKNGIIIPNRSLSAYCGFDFLENELKVPMYGGRFLQRAEDRRAKNNQYDILRKAGIEFPRIFESAEEIDRLVVVKVQQKDNPLERAFFYPSNLKEFKEMSDEQIQKGIISKEGLDEAVTEEFLVGPKVNANYHSFALHPLLPGYFPTKIDLVGFGKRRQANLSGLMEIPASEQEKIAGKIKITNEEVSHEGVTVRESLHEKFYDIGERFVGAANSFYPREMIGMFGLQGAVVIDQETLRPKFKVFDASLRIPGDPAIGPTSPSMRVLSFKYAYVQKDLRKTTDYKGREIVDPLDLTMLEIAAAVKQNMLEEIVT